MTPATNLFADLPGRLPEELITTLHEAANIRIERIVSHGHASPPGFAYDQPRHEWVILLQGAARVCFEDGGDAVAMNPGDFLYIPAHRRHRVQWTAPDQATIWLAVHFGEPS